jgi:MtN3 and saliva related transmembrane protein
MKQVTETRWKKLVELFMTIMGFLGSVATIPTVLKIWCTHPQHAGGQSVITWSFYALLAMFWVVYGIYYRHAAIWATNIIYLILYFIIVIGIFRQAGVTW